MNVLNGLTSNWASCLALSRSLYRAARPNLTSSSRADRDSAPFFEIIEPDKQTHLDLHV